MTASMFQNEISSSQSYLLAMAFCEIVKSKRGGYLLSDGKYMFRKKNKNKNVSYWRCCVEGCEGKAQTVGANFQVKCISEKSDHNH